MHHLCLKIVEQAPIDPWFSTSTSPEAPEIEWRSNCIPVRAPWRCISPAIYPFLDPPLHQNSCRRQDDCHQWGSGGIKAFPRADHGSNRLEHGSGYGGLHLSTPPSRPPHPADHRNIPHCHFRLPVDVAKCSTTKTTPRYFGKAQEGEEIWTACKSLEWRGQKLAHGEDILECGPERLRHTRLRQGSVYRNFYL